MDNKLSQNDNLLRTKNLQKNLNNFKVKSTPFVSFGNYLVTK